MILVSNVSKKVKFKKEVLTLIDNISFKINEGEIVGYVGSNGAGKSTTIKMLTGIFEPSNGLIKVNDIIPYKNRIKNASNIGVVFGQRTQLWWDLPLIDSYKILKKIYKIDEDIFKERLNYLTNLFEINNLLNSTVRILSLGERMKADLIASMLHNPKVLYLDEPTIGLDSISKRKMRSAIKNLNLKFNTTIVLTTHDFVDVEELCDRIIILKKGNIIFDGTLEYINKEYRNYKIIEITSNINNLKELSKKIESSILENGKLKVKYSKYDIEKNNYILNLINDFTKYDINIKDVSLEDIVEKITNDYVKD